MSESNFFAELKRRNVYKVAVAYAIVGWLLIQVATATFPVLEIPNWAIKLVIALVLLGFPIALILAWAFELTPEGIKRTESADELSSKPSRSRAWIYVVIISGAISGGLFFVGRYTALDKQSGSAEVSSKSIAVLPFENLSEEKANAYFADGIQDEILTRLSKIADLKVISRTSTQKYKSAPDNLREIAHQLGVSNILEGSVQKVSDQVRVSVQLIDVRNDSHLWAETYDRKLTDIFGVESDVAKSIAQALQAKLSGHEEQAFGVKPTNNPEAYDAYLRGLAAEGESIRSVYPIQKAISFYKRAVHLDPNFALAWSKLSGAHSSLYPSFGDSTEAAKRALETAQKLQPDSPETLLALAQYQYSELHDYEAARTNFLGVSKMLPGSSEIPAALAQIARHQGKWDEAVASLEEAGVPAGVVNVIPSRSSGKVVSAMLHDPRVRVISFTGSTAAGRKVGEQAGRLLKRAHLELGGNSALIVMEDADLDLAVSAAAFGSFMHQGQICMTTGRHLVQDSVYDDYVAALAEKASHLPVGNPATEQVALGPIIDERQRDKVHQLVTATVDAGARLAAGGTYDRLFYQPTVLADVAPQMPAYAQEVFGPVAPVLRFSSADRAGLKGFPPVSVRVAAGNEYGRSSVAPRRPFGSCVVRMIAPPGLSAFCLSPPLQPARASRATAASRSAAFLVRLTAY
jgi:TolB-like protein